MAADGDTEWGDPHGPAAAVAAEVRKAEKLYAQAPRDLQREMAPMLQKLRDAFAAQVRIDAVRAAGEALEAHVGELDALLADEDAYLDRVGALFDEPAFAKHWFSAGDVGRAYAKVGYPVDPRKSAEVTRAALLFLATKRVRRRIFEEASALLPEYVKTARFLDGCIVRLLAVQTVEDENEVNPLLLALFLHGHREWLAEWERVSAEALESAGLSVSEFRQMSPGQAMAWLNRQAIDPHKEALFRGKLAANPAFEAMATANAAVREDASLAWIQTGDAQDLLLPATEVLPWLNQFSERSFDTMKAMAEAAGRGLPPDRDQLERVGSILWDLAHDMAAELFTRERREELVAQMSGFLDDARASQDEDTMLAIEGALAMVCSGQPPQDVAFVRALCYHSMVRGLKEFGADEDSASD